MRPFLRTCEPVTNNPPHLLGQSASQSEYKSEPNSAINTETVDKAKQEGKILLFFNLHEY